MGKIESASNMTLNQNTPIFQITYMNGALYSLYDNQVWVKQSPAISSSPTIITEQSEEPNSAFTLILISLSTFVALAGAVYLSVNRRAKNKA